MNAAVCLFSQTAAYYPYYLFFESKPLKIKLTSRQEYECHILYSCHFFQCEVNFLRLFRVRKRYQLFDFPFRIPESYMDSIIFKRRPPANGYTRNSSFPEIHIMEFHSYIIADSVDSAAGHGKAVPIHIVALTG